MNKLKEIIQFAESGDLTNMRKSLFDTIMEKVSEKLEEKKKEVSKGIFSKKKSNDTEPETSDCGDSDNGQHSDEKEDRKLIKTMVKKDALQNNESFVTEDFIIGDFVVPAIGPHAGVKHKIIHSYGDGNYNIKPEMDAKKVKYRHGAVKANKSQISKWKDGVKEEKSDWIKDAIKHKGALHKELGVPEGEGIPEKELEADAKKSGKLGQRARLALTLKKMH